MPTIGQPTILLVDSEIVELDKNARLLEEIGYFNHLHAENGSEAVAMFKNFKPDMVVMAFELPDINGQNILALIRQSESVEIRSLVMVYGKNVADLILAKMGSVGLDKFLRCPYQDADFKQAIEEVIMQTSDPNFVKTEKLQEKCRTQIESGQFEEALSTCNDILEIDDNAEVYYNLGYILSIRGNLEKALEHFRKATIINNQHARAFTQMGFIYQKLGRPGEAQECLEHAAELHMVLNQETEAEEVLNVVLTLRPDTTNVYNSLGIIYRRQGRLKESISAYRKALKVNPEDENIFFNMARAYLDNNEPVEAEECLKKAININSAFMPARDLLRAIELGLKLKST
ncbi:MAG: tetratricopeptide repeat protein [Deltaproteobacteria bacterium]|nr:tetratricopeptide repeat protein [Deltaproteobacteria bacterium]